MRWKPTAPMPSAGISISSSAPWLPNRFYGKAVSGGHSASSWAPLWNTYAFFVLYANIDQFDADGVYALGYGQPRR